MNAEPSAPIRALQNEPWTKSIAPLLGQLFTIQLLLPDMLHISLSGGPVGVKA